MNLKLLVSSVILVMSQDQLVTDVTACIGSAWKAFHGLLPILTNKGISLVNCGKVFKGCIRSVLLYGNETWPLCREDLSQIKRCDHAMIHWLSNVKIKQKHSTEDVRRKIYVHHIEYVLKWMFSVLSLYERRASFCMRLISRKLHGFFLMFSTCFTSLSVLLLFPLLITCFVVMHGF